MANMWGDDEPVANAPATPPQPEQPAVTAYTSPYVAGDVGLMDAQAELTQSHTVAGDANTKQATSDQLESVIKQRIAEVMSGPNALSGQAAIDKAMQGMQVPPGYERMAQQLAQQAEVQNRDVRDMMNATPSGQSMGAEESKGMGGLFGLGALGGMLAGLPQKAQETVQTVISSLKNAFKGKDTDVQDVSPSLLSQLSPSQTPVGSIPTPQLGQQNQTYAGRALNA